VIVKDGGASGGEPSPLAKTLLEAFSAGSLSEPFAVLVAAHLQMQRERGVLPFALHAWSRRARDENQAPWDQISATMPLALRSYVARQHGAPGTLEWRSFLPGIERCWISRAGGIDAYLLRCRPGRAMPKHTHAGREAALVLQGSYHDAHGRYGVGDVAVANHTVEHRPIAGRPDACIIFVVLEAPVRLTGLFGRLIQRLFGV
jgi:putative transcriptional regulator